MEEKEIQPETIVHKDVILSYLVTLANKSSMEIGLTLSVKGVMVSGSLIGIKTYCDESVRLLKLALDEKNASTLALPFDAVKEGVEDKEDTFIDYNYIHLKDAKFYSPGNSAGPLMQPGVLWRGKISEIDGFFIGTISMD